MRVAIFTDNDFSKINGVTTALRAVLAHAPSSIQPRIYTASDLGEDSRSYFAAASWGIGLPWYREMRVYLPRLRRLARALKRDGVDVIHLTTPGPIGLAGRWLASRLGVPVVGSYHTHLAEYAETLSGSARLGAAMEEYMRWMYRPCDPLLVPSEATRRMLYRRRYRAERLGIWRRGVDATRLRPQRASAALRASWHVDDRRPAVLYAGRLSREKGLGDVPAIASALAKQRLPYQLVFVGDGPMRATLQAACPDAVFTGAINHDAVAVAMASADVFLFPSATDALGNVVLEAQASGLPVVVSHRGGPREQMTPDITGFVCRAGRPAEFADAVASVLRSLDVRRRMGAAAREQALCRNWPAALAPLYEAWRQAVSRSAGAATPYLALADPPQAAC
jgi:glycosyltransferase involved in cell wall biosynthesis